MIIGKAPCTTLRRKPCRRLKSAGRLKPSVWPFPGELLPPRRRFSLDRGILQLDGNHSVDLEFFDCLQVRRKFYHSSTGRKITMNFTVAITEVNMDRSVLEFNHLRGAGI